MEVNAASSIPAPVRDAIRTKHAGKFRTPEVRRQGIGARLIQAAEDWARRQGFTQLSLHVTEGNAAAIALYERREFRFTGEFDRYPNDRTLRELFMLKRLD